MPLQIQQPKPQVPAEHSTLKMFSFGQHGLSTLLHGYCSPVWGLKMRELMRIDHTRADTARDKNYSRAFSDNNIVIEPGGWFACESEHMKKFTSGGNDAVEWEDMLPFMQKTHFMLTRWQDSALLNVQDTKHKLCGYPWPLISQWSEQTVLLLVISLVCRYYTIINQDEIPPQSTNWV